MAIIVIMVTGMWQTMDNPFVRVDSYADLGVLRERTLYGDLLFWKHVFVFMTFGLSLVNRFYLAPRAEFGLVARTDDRATMAGTPAASMLKPAVLLNLAAAFGALLLASRMVLELH